MRTHILSNKQDVVITHEWIDAALEMLFVEAELERNRAYTQSLIDNPGGRQFHNRQGAPVSASELAEDWFISRNEWAEDWLAGRYRWAEQML